MSTKINDIGFIKELQGAIKICSEKSLNHLPNIKIFLEEKKQNLFKVQSELEYRLNDAERKLSNRNNMLTLCQSRIEYDKNGNRKSPNCSAEEGAVQRARTDQKAARNNVESIKELLRVVASKIMEYEKKMELFVALNTDFTKSSIDYLDKIIELFNNYTDLADEYKNI